MGRILYTGREPGGQSFLWPDHCWPDLAIYPHARTSRPSRSEDRAHAYLMLLRVEVAAFHPAMPPAVAGRRDTEWPCLCGACAPPASQTRLCGPIPRLAGVATGPTDGR